eukprot:1176812-Prorocentrum_minimum.AAC.3
MEVGLAFPDKESGSRLVKVSKAESYVQPQDATFTLIQSTISVPLTTRGYTGLGDQESPVEKIVTKKISTNRNTHLEHAEGLVDVAAEGKVVDGGVLDDALLVDDEQAAERNALIGQHIEGRGDLLLKVGHQGVGEVAETTGLAVGLDPGKVRELGVHGHTEDLHDTCRRMSEKTRGREVRGAIVIGNSTPARGDIHQKNALHNSVLPQCSAWRTPHGDRRRRWMQRMRMNYTMSNSTQSGIWAVPVGHTKVKSRG